jgi:FkbM family methyltransferase
MRFSLSLQGEGYGEGEAGCGGSKTHPAVVASAKSNESTIQIMNSIASKPHLDCLIHLGAGRCSELDQYLAREPGRLVLVEADSKLAAALVDRVADQPNIRVLNAAVAAQSSQGTYHRYNLPDANSLRPATGLHELFPGLRLLETEPVETLAINELVKSIDLEGQRNNRLIIDLPGLESEVFLALEAGDSLHLFNRIELVAGREALYEGSMGAAELRDWLASHGFDLIDDDASEDPDLPRFLFRRNDLALEVRDLRLQVEQLVRERDELHQLLESERAKFRQRNQETDRQSEVNTDQAKRIEELERELRSTLEQREKASKEIQELGREIDRITRAYDQATARAQEAAQRIADLEAENVETQIRQKLLDQQMTRAEAQIDLVKDVLLRDA